MLFIALLFLFAGYAIGLGAVTVIDIHGFLGRQSSYWTEATIRTHKVTKPMIWIGIFLLIIGGSLLYIGQAWHWVMLLHIVIASVLLMNGLYLSFVISPALLKREQEGRASEILPKSMQMHITIGLLLSDAGWWISLILFAYYITYILP